MKLHTISRILLFHTCDWCRRRNLSEFGIEILSLSRTRRCLEQGLLLWITSRVSKKTIFDCGPSNLLLLTTHVTVKPRGFKAKRAEFVASFLVLLHSLLFLLLLRFLTTNSLCLSTKPDRRSSSSFSFFNCKGKKNYFVKMKFWMSISQKQINIFYWFIRDILSLQNVFCFLNISKAFLTFSPWILTFDINCWN